MVRSAAVVPALVFALTVPAVGDAASPITIDPAVGDPATVFHIEVPASYPIKQTRDRYWFALHGPGGRRCESSVTDRVGITPGKRAQTVFVDLPGVRVVSSRQIVPGPWCVGTFSGRVEFRDWRPRARKYVIHGIGTFSVQVQAGG
jgi:hypothetical protein